MPFEVISEEEMEEEMSNGESLEVTPVKETEEGNLREYTEEEKKKEEKRIRNWAKEHGYYISDEQAKDLRFKKDKVWKKRVKEEGEKLEEEGEGKEPETKEGWEERLEEQGFSEDTAERMAEPLGRTSSYGPTIRRLNLEPTMEEIEWYRKDVKEEEAEYKTAKQELISFTKRSRGIGLVRHEGEIKWENPFAIANIVSRANLKQLNELVSKFNLEARTYRSSAEKLNEKIQLYNIKVGLAKEFGGKYLEAQVEEIEQIPNVSITKTNQGFKIKKEETKKVTKEDIENISKKVEGLKGNVSEFQPEKGGISGIFGIQLKDLSPENIWKDLKGVYEFGQEGVSWATQKLVKGGKETLRGFGYAVGGLPKMTIEIGGKEFELPRSGPVPRKSIKGATIKNLPHRIFLTPKEEEGIEALGRSIKMGYYGTQLGMASVMSPIIPTAINVGTVGLESIGLGKAVLKGRAKEYVGEKIQRLPQYGIGALTYLGGRGLGFAVEDINIQESVLGQEDVWQTGESKYAGRSIYYARASRSSETVRAKTISRMLARRISPEKYETLGWAKTTIGKDKFASLGIGISQKQGDFFATSSLTRTFPGGITRSFGASTKREAYLPVREFPYGDFLTKKVPTTETAGMFKNLKTGGSGIYKGVFKRGGPKSVVLRPKAYMYKFTSGILKSQVKAKPKPVSEQFGLPSKTSSFGFMRQISRPSTINGIKSALSIPSLTLERPVVFTEKTAPMEEIRTMGPVEGKVKPKPKTGVKEIQKTRNFELERFRPELVSLEKRRERPRQVPRVNIRPKERVKPRAMTDVVPRETPKEFVQEEIKEEVKIGPRTFQGVAQVPREKTRQLPPMEVLRFEFQEPPPSIPLVSQGIGLAPERKRREKKGQKKEEREGIYLPNLAGMITGGEAKKEFQKGLFTGAEIRPLPEEDLFK